MTQKKTADTVWILWQCDHGRRWSSVKGTFVSPFVADGMECNFSGCTLGHKAHIVGETPFRAVTYQWFHDGEKAKENYPWMLGMSIMESAHYFGELQECLHCAGTDGKHYAICEYANSDYKPTNYFNGKGEVEKTI